MEDIYQRRRPSSTIKNNAKMLDKLNNLSQFFLNVNDIKNTLNIEADIIL